jgi:chaperonin GroES
MSVALKPLADRIVAVREEAENKTASGLYLPDAAKEKPVVAKVVAVGKEVKEVKAGDRVVYKEYTPTELKQNGIEYLILKEEDVLALVTK